MNYKKLTAVFMALGIAATCFSGCGLTEGNGGTSASEPTKAAATAAPKPTKAAAQTGSGSQSGNTGNTSSEAEKEITYINGVLTDSDEDSVTIEYGSDGDFNQTTFDISNADIQIGENKKQGGPLAASLNLKIGYYVENGDYIAVSVYGDGSESTECQLVFAEATRKYIEAGKDQQGKGFDPRKLLAPGAQAIIDKCKEKIELFGCAGKA